MAGIDSRAAMIPVTHIVFGGSRGIGFAYAKWLAQRGFRLVIVDQCPDTLALARSQLLAMGSPAVDVHACDLKVADARNAMLQSLDPNDASSIFIRGPSPPAGTVTEVSLVNVETTVNICLLYPTSVFSWLSTAHSARSQRRVILLSSSATEESLLGHPFFLSAVMRRATENLSHGYATAITDITLHIWRPQIVLTDLSIAFARTAMADKYSDDKSAVTWLKARFNVRHLPTPDEFVPQNFCDIN